jgi:hypothetical protein
MHATFTAMGGVYVMCVPQTVDEVVRRHRVHAEHGRELYLDRMELVAEYYHTLLTGQWLGRPMQNGSFFDDIVKSGGMAMWANVLRYSIPQETPVQITERLQKLL